MSCALRRAIASIALGAWVAFVCTAAAAPDAAALQVPRPTARQLYVQVLAAYILDRDRTKAESGFKRVAQLDPRYAPAWFDLGVLAEGDRQWDSARKYFEEYLHCAPSGADAARARAQVTLLSRYATGAIRPEIEHRIEYDAMITRARAFRAAGLYREAIAEAGRAQSSDPGRWEAYAVVALCMAQQHKPAAAQRFRLRALMHAPAAQHEAIDAALTRKISDFSR